MKPLLAATLTDPSKLKFPLLASPKLDGIRCLFMESRVTEGKRITYSRTLKPIPNIHIRNTIANSTLPLGLDGELIIGPTFQDTTSGVMSVGGEPAFQYHVFDYCGDGINVPYIKRLCMLHEICDEAKLDWLKLVPQIKIESLAELEKREQLWLDSGFEGVMLRSMTGRYKYGRSTLLEGILLKMKRFTDAEAKVVGFTELEHNCNEQTRDNLGNAERSSVGAMMLPGNTLGALVVKDCKTGIEFSIGTGFTAAQRKEIWDNRTKYSGAICTYKYQNHGIKVAPRAPVFLRWREDYKL